MAGRGIGHIALTQAALRKARRPKACKLAANPTLALIVEEKLGLWVVAPADLGMIERVIP